MNQRSADSRLARIQAQARSIPDTLALDQANELADSPVPDERLLALMRMRVAIDRGVPPPTYLGIARQLVKDEDNDCRWQALIVIGESISQDPASVWNVVEELGSADDPDLRMGVATVLLEHLLDLHFDRFYGPVVKRVVSGDKRFADTLSSCWVSSPDSPSRHKLDHLLEASKRGVRGPK